MPDYTANGQQVLKDGQHFADTHSTEAAAEIVRALQAATGIPAYLESEAAKTPRARVRARTLLVAAGNIRAGLWQEDEAGPEGVRARYNELNAPPAVECVPTVLEG